MQLRKINGFVICFAISFIHTYASAPNTHNSPHNLSELVSEIVPFEKSNDKFVIPGNIQHIRLDIGLSYNAPMSQDWLSHEENLIVFGFEPNPASVRSILEGAKKRHPSHGTPLEKRFIGERFFLIPCALGLSSQSAIDFYITKQDCGCSSIHVPKFFDIESIITVPIFKLSDFFDLFPFDTHPVIDYIKIDAQGEDLNIVKSAGTYLTERVVFITLEAEDSQYQNTHNSTAEIDVYMQSIGFQRYYSPYVTDPTYFNPRYIDYVKNNPVRIYQKG